MPKQPTNEAALEAYALAMIRERCVLERDGQMWGNVWVDTVARNMVASIDFLLDGDLETAFRVGVMREDRNEVTT